MKILRTILSSLARVHLRNKNTFVVFAILAPLELASTATIHVSPHGSDHGSGGPDSPFQTIERARDEIRKRKADGVVSEFVVELSPGPHLLESTFKLSSLDSGKKGAPITYRSAEGGQAILLGAIRVSLAMFERVSDTAVLARLDPAARGQVLSLSIREMSLKHGGPFPDVFRDRGGIFELFDSQGRMPLSRWPDAGYSTMGPVLTIGDKSCPGAFEFKDDRPLRWANNPDVWLKGQWRVGWEDPAIRVAAIDPSARTITFAAGIANGIGSKYHRPSAGGPVGSGAEPWAAINLIEEIDRPGEWAIDFSSERLFVWPRDGETEIMISQLDSPLISVDGASNLVFQNLRLEHSLGDGIVLEAVTECFVVGCNIKDIAGRGIVLHGNRSGVLSCDVSHVGEGAIYVSGGDRRMITRSENFVINNHVHHYGLLKRQYSAGVHVGAMGDNSEGKALRDAVGIRIAHNVLHHAPRDAFLYSGNDNVFEYNEVYYCGFDTKDTGAWYSWLDWTMRGNIIRYNFVHNTIGGINPDDGASGNTAYGNVFAGPNVGVWIASGPDNTIRHNIFIKAEGPVFAIDDRGVGRGYASNHRLIQRVQELNPSEDPWKTAHPEMSDMLENRPELPWRTQFVGNVIYSNQPTAPIMNKMTAVTRKLDGILEEHGNLTISDDPETVRRAGTDFNWAPDPTIYERVPGFEPIPFEKVGLYIDEHRVNLPSEEQRMRSREYSPYNEDQDDSFGT